MKTPLRSALLALPAFVTITALLAGCTTTAEEAENLDARLETVASGDLFDEPMAVAVRPGTSELWVTNRGNDSITVIDTAAEANGIRLLQDGYGEHFTARPSGIAFSEDGGFFAVSNDSNNEVRDIDFALNPERNTHFKGNNFMGPSLFSADSFALAGQNKPYMADWPQPGISHDPPDDTPEHECPDEYWSEGTSHCIWPRQGSHLDMLHGNPLSTGILHDAVNAYFVLDGCGAFGDDDVCTGPGHVAHVDFNRDHQEGNGFHGDGTTTRFIDLPYERVEGVPSGMIRHDDWIYYSDTGAGLVRRFQPATGDRQVMVANWNDSPASHGEHGPGVIDWSHIEHGPGDGDDPETVRNWVADRGDHEAIAAAAGDWIHPMETLAEYSYVRDATREEATASGMLSRPAGLAAGADSWFVADNATGLVHEFGWDGTQRRVFDTGHSGLTGIALSDDGASLFLVDSVDNAVYRLDVG